MSLNDWMKKHYKSKNLRASSWLGDQGRIQRRCSSVKHQSPCCLSQSSLKLGKSSAVVWGGETKNISAACPPLNLCKGSNMLPADVSVQAPLSITILVFRLSALLFSVVALWHCRGRCEPVYTSTQEAAVEEESRQSWMWLFCIKTLQSVSVRQHIGWAALVLMFFWSL